MIAVGVPSSACPSAVGFPPASRIARQWILTRDTPPPPRLWVLLDEGILYRPVAPAPVMRDQLDHLMAMSHRPNVTIQVVPYAAGGHSGLLGAFIQATPCRRRHHET